MAGPVSVRDIEERYAFDRAWVLRRLEERERAGVVVRGVFGGDREVTRWCSRRVLEQARRRELARARKQIAAVSIPAFAWFLQRWQHLEPASRLSGPEGTRTALAQLHGLARPAEAWERDYLPSRVEGYDPGWLGALAAGGRVVWAAEPPSDRAPARTSSTGVGRLRFFERGTGRLWVRTAVDDTALSEPARAVREALRAHGASFTSDLAAATSLGPQRLRDALRELVAAGLVTNDTIDAMRDVIRWRPVFPVKRRDEPDPTRWLPADFTPSPNRPVVQRRVNPRRLARWRRPDRPESAAWAGRWSLVHTPGTLGPEPEAPHDSAEAVARQWLARYGVVSRDWWRREHPAVGWREIYHELKRLEFRGEVRRGYFVAGLAGAQFALPDAVEILRSSAVLPEGRDEPVVMAASDPANVYALALPEDAIEPIARPRGAGGMLVTVAGAVIVSAEGHGRRLRVREDAPADIVRTALTALVGRLTAHGRHGRRHDVIIETIDGEPAATSSHAPLLRELGFARDGRLLRHDSRLR
jgi:ATP-dependent Lhr-like helicase